MFRGKLICRNLYCFLHDVGKQKVQVIGRALDQNGLTARVHGNKNRQPIHSLTFKDIQNVLEFLTRYASENAIVLPGRLPYVKNAQVLLLPSDKRQADIHEIYEQSAALSQLRSISLSTFTRIWHDLCPNIVLKPQTDLCHKCQMYISKLSNGGNMDETEKKEILLGYENHLEIAKRERDFYRDNCLESKATFKSECPVEG